MAKPILQEPFRTLERDMIETMVAGLKEWRADLDYPESYSDFQGCVRGLFRMFDIKRLPLPRDLKDMVATPECE